MRGVATPARLGTASAFLLVAALLALLPTGTSPPSTELSVAGSEPSAAPTVPPTLADPVPSTTSSSTTSSTSPPSPPSSIATRKPPALRAPVVLEKQYGDLPAGTVMSGPVRVTGTVRDSAGLPVEMACIRVDVATDPGVANARTGPDGRFDVTVHVGAFRDWIFVWAIDCSGDVPGFVRQRIPVMASPLQPVDVPITVVPGSAVSGTVRTSTGEPLAHHCVHITMNEVWANTRADAEGRWMIAGLPTGRFAATVHPVLSDCDVDNRLASSGYQSGTIPPTGAMVTMDLVAIPSELGIP